MEILNYNLPKQILRRCYDVTSDMYSYTDTLEGHVRYYTHSGVVTNVKLPEEKYFTIEKNKHDYFSYSALQVAYHEIGHLYFKHNYVKNGKKPHYIEEFEAEYYALRFLRKIKTPKKIYDRIEKDSKEYLSNVFFSDKNDRKKIKFKDLDHRYLKFLGKEFHAHTIIFSVTTSEFNDDNFKYSDFQKRCDLVFNSDKSRKLKNKNKNKKIFNLFNRIIKKMSFFKI